MTTRQIRRPGPSVRALVVGARFLAGRDLDGRERTNARWGAAGTELVDARRAGRWAHQSRRRRTGVRLAALVTAALVAYGALVDPPSTATTVRVAVWLLLGIVAYVVVHKTRRWSHYQQWVVPTATALADRLGISRHIEPLSWVSVPAGHREDPDRPAVITLPADYHAPQTQQKALAALAASKLGLVHPDWTIDMTGERPVLTLRAQPGPPDLVRYAAIQQLLEDAPEDAPLLGLAAREQPVSASWALDAPSMLVSAGSGSGKSVIGRLLAAQALHHGGRVIIIDSVKHGASHKWAKGLHGVQLHRQPETAHNALVALAREVERRCEADWHGQDISAEQRILVLIEESNATTKQLASYWAGIREPDEPKRSPALQGIDDISCVGRQARTNLVSVGQMMTANASGSNVARENAGIRVLARFTRNQARMLIPEIQPPPRSSRHPGRTQIAVAGEAVETQIAYLTDAEAVEWATSGVPVCPGNQPVQVTGVTPLRRPGRDLVSLSGAAAELGVAVSSLRSGRARDPEFPKCRRMDGQTQMFERDDLHAWLRNRERATAGDAS